MLLLLFFSDSRFKKLSVVKKYYSVEGWRRGLFYSKRDCRSGQCLLNSVPTVWL